MKYVIALLLVLSAAACGFTPESRPYPDMAVGQAGAE